MHHYPLRSHGIVDQEAPEAHAQEEAQEDAQAHALPTPQVADPVLFADRSF
jgi:hypothetical protein